MSMLADVVDVVIGVDTHKHTHTAAVVMAGTGAAVAEQTVPTDGTGYAALVALADRHRGVRVWAVEGTGGYGAGLTRFLTARGEQVIEVDRPHRPARRSGAKSDPIDAVRAARDALARTQVGQPRAGGDRAALALRLTARRSAVDAATDATCQLHALITAAPEPLRAQLRHHSTRQLVTVCAHLEPVAGADPHTVTTIDVARHLAQRILTVRAEARHHEHAITAIVRTWRPDLLEEFGVGPIVAAVVLCAWSHPGRCRNDAAFAALAGVAPLPASSGQTVRYRLNRGGDRQLNRALHIITIHRMRHDPVTRAYTQRRQTEGKTDREIRRCLKRYIARQLYHQLETGT
jgi:transposase